MNALPDTASRAESPDVVTSAKCQREGKECVHVCAYVWASLHGCVCASFMERFIGSIVTSDFHTDLNAEIAKSDFM